MILDRVSQTGADRYRRALFATGALKSGSSASSAYFAGGRPWTRDEGKLATCATAIRFLAVFSWLTIPRRLGRFGRDQNLEFGDHCCGDRGYLSGRGQRSVRIAHRWRRSSELFGEDLDLALDGGRVRLCVGVGEEGLVLAVGSVMAGRGWVRVVGPVAFLGHRSVVSDLGYQRLLRVGVVAQQGL